MGGLGGRVWREEGQRGLGKEKKKSVWDAHTHTHTHTWTHAHTHTQAKPRQKEGGEEGKGHIGQ